MSKNYRTRTYGGGADEATSVEFNIGNVTAVNGDLTLEICPNQSLYNLATLATPNSQDKTKGSE